MSNGESYLCFESVMLKLRLRSFIILGVILWVVLCWHNNISLALSFIKKKKKYFLVSFLLTNRASLWIFLGFNLFSWQVQCSFVFLGFSTPLEVLFQGSFLFHTWHIRRNSVINNTNGSLKHLWVFENIPYRLLLELG